LKVIESIDSIFDGNLYDEHGLNCFVVPKYAATQAFRKFNPDLYYLYFYFFHHYYFLTHPVYQEFMNTINYNDNRESIDRYVLRRKLGITVTAVKIDNDLVRKINGKSAPALRMSTGDISAQFYMKEELLEEAFAGYNESYTYLKDHIQTMAYYGQPGAHSLHEALSDVAVTVKPYLGNESAILKPKLNYLIQEREVNRIPFINSQKIFFKTLLKAIPDMPHYNERKTEIDRLAAECVSGWNRLAAEIGILRSRNTFAEEKIRGTFDKLVDVEKDVLSALYHVGVSIGKDERLSESV
jgi:hypothetical protein